MLWFFAVASSAAAAPLAVVDSPTVPAYSSNLTNTTAKTSTAETNTAADAPLAEASDGRQRPWWERLSEKHRELHKGQSWCVVHSVQSAPSTTQNTLTLEYSNACAAVARRQRA